MMKNTKIKISIVEYSTMGSIFDLKGMYVRDAAYAIGPYGYVLRVAWRDGCRIPKPYEPNWGTYERWRVNVGVINNRICEVYGVG